MPHILVVEDDAATRDLLEQYLGDYKFRVTAAATLTRSQSAVGALAQERTALITLNVQMSTTPACAPAADKSASYSRTMSRLARVTMNSCPSSV